MRKQIPSPGEILQRSISARKAFKKRCQGTPIAYLIDDFTSYCIEQWQSGARPLNSRIAYLIGDFSRRQGGTKRGDMFIKGLKNEPPIHVQEDYDEHFIERLPAQDRQKDRTLAFVKNMKLSPLDRAVLVLFYQWGLTQGEIGDVFGYSEGRICQMRLVVENRIREEMIS